MCNNRILNEMVVFYFRRISYVTAVTDCKDLVA